MEYQSPFENWYTYSTVHKPLPDLTCETGLVLFPPELVPGIGHPLVDKLGNHAMRLLTMRKLESYNDFTEKLEYKAIMTGSIKIAQNPRAFGLSEQAGREARLIVTDESHHAYVAIELMKRIPGMSELPPLTQSQPLFFERVGGARERSSDRVRRRSPGCVRLYLRDAHNVDAAKNPA
jgi:hypothetical protein